MGQGLSRRWILIEAVQWTSLQSLLCFTSSQATGSWEVVGFKELMASGGVILLLSCTSHQENLHPAAEPKG